MPIMIVHMYR